MKTNPAKNMPVRETSQFMREMWAAEAEHPVFAGSLFNLRCMAAGAAKPRKRSTTKTQKKNRTTVRRFHSLDMNLPARSSVKNFIDELPILEPSQFMLEMWAAEAEHPVFAGSLFNLRCMAAGAAKPRKRSTAKTS